MTETIRLLQVPLNYFRKEPIYLIIVLFFILELIFPFIISNYWILRIILFANLFVIYATSFDLLAGYGGIISFGHSLFFGGAGYLAGLLSLNFGLPLIVCIITGCLFALIVGLFLGYICLRLKGPYLAVVTLICPLVVLTLLYISPTILGGENGIAGFAQLAGGSLVKQFYIVLIVTTISLLIISVLAKGNFGLILKAIREDEIGAEAAGINTTKYKLMAFIVSGFFSGISGTLYAHIMGSIGPTMMSLQYGMIPVFMVYLGGASSIIGPFIGAYVVTFLDLYLLAFPYLRIIIYAATIIFVLRFFPNGLIAVPNEIGRLKRWLS